MRATLLIAIVAVSMSALAQSPDVLGKKTTTTKLADSSYTWMMDMSMNEWQLFDKTINTYDSRLNLTESVYWSFVPPNSWINQYTATNEYDENDSLTRILYSTGRENYLMVEIEYDNLGRMVSNTLKEWDGLIWVTTMIQTLTYDSENKLLTHKTTIMPASDGNYSVETFTYDDADYLVNNLFENFENSILTAKRQSIYENDGFGYSVSDLIQEWQQNAWQNLVHIDYTYDNFHNQLSLVEKSWNNGIWENSWQYISTYDDHDNLLTHTMYYYDNSQWNKSSERKQTFDTENFMTYSVGKGFDLTGAVYSADSVHYYSGESLGWQELVQHNTLLLYPNPTTGLFSVSCELPLEAVEVFNLVGEKVLSVTPANRHTVPMNLTDQDKGVYIVKTRSANRLEIGKIIIQ